MLNGEDIVKAASVAYTRCRTYVDAGSVQTLIRRADGETDRFTSCRFKTAFVRPDRFRFEFSIQLPNRTEWNRCLIVMKGAEVLSCWDWRPGVERPESLAMAIAGATGVSESAAWQIPALLMPDRVSSRPMVEWGELTRLEDAVLDGVTCFRVERREVINSEVAYRLREIASRSHWTSPPHYDPITDVLWFDSGSLLIKQVDAVPSCRTKWVTTYQPEFDAHVGDDQLLFDPPEQ